MNYEVEKRSKLEGKSEFDRIKKYLENHAEFLGKKEMKSYLYQKPTFLRIRLISGKKEAIITEKTGDYNQAGRPEEEHNIPISKVNEFVKQKEKEGYSDCSLVHTTRRSYRLNGLNIELNEIDYLGLIVEVEALTKNKSDVPFLETKIREAMKELKIKELNPNEYQRMINYMYVQTLKHVTEHNFLID